jgi:hypothetical protein
MNGNDPLVAFIECALLAEVTTPKVHVEETEPWQQDGGT